MPKFADSLQLTVNRKKESVYGHGYTLIEFLVVLGLLVLTVGSAMIFLTSILRGSNQANISAEVKQNGQAVLDSLDRQIRGAKSAVSISSGQLSSISASAISGVSLTNSNGSMLHIVCFVNTASLNGYIGTSTQTTVGSLSDYKTVTNSDVISGVNIICDSNSFSVASGSTQAGDIVAINFTAGRAINAPERVDFDATAKFNTTISLRKY